MTRRDLGHMFLGLLIAALAMGWYSEYRVRLSERAGYERWEARAIEHQGIMDTALRLAAQNPVERGLAISESITDYLKRTQKHSSVRDDGPTKPTTKGRAGERTAP